MSPEDLVLGVDGGGTKTVAWLAPLHDDGTVQVLGKGDAGPGNPRSAGFEVAQQSIDNAIGAAFADARLPRAPVAAACFGLAGAGRQTEQDTIAAWAAKRRFARSVRIHSDPELALAAGTPENWGIALLCGTGSLAFGRTADGRVDRCGGWGYLLGDEGSGYAIAMAALNAAVRAADGRGEPTILLERFMKTLGAATPMALTERVYEATVTPAHLAHGAKLVFEAAETDAVAQRILGKAADELAEMVVTLSRRLGFAAGRYPLALAGSVIVKQVGFRAQVLDRLKQAGAEPSASEIVPKPVRGAVILARRAALAK
jgi:N-acetylglucosamine kinase-like BadF-type ATPase